MVCGASPGSSATVISALLTGLAPHTTYFFRARATNSEGTTVGDTLSFTTQNTYDVWKVEQFGGQSGDAFISGPGANPDRDALVNLLEYALGSVPTIAGDLLPDARLTDGYLTLTYTRPKDRSDLAYAVEVAPAPDRPWRSDLTAEVSRVERGATETLQIRSTTPSVSVPGQVIRLRMPDLTQDRRKELVKVAHQYAEKARIAVRNVRRDGMDQLKALEKDHAMSEDDHKKKSEETQKMTDDTIKEIDASLKSKEAEIMQVRDCNAPC